MSSFCSIEADKTRMSGVGIVDDNDDTHYPYHGRRHRDRAVTGLWLVNLHDGERGTRQVSQGTSLLAPQRTLLERQSGVRFSHTHGSAHAVATTCTRTSAFTTR
jgi:hypothetical protein